MATITLTLSSADLTRAVNVLSARWEYKALIPGDNGIGLIPNPQTPGEFVKQHIAQWLRDEVKEHELNIARSTAVITPVVIT